MGVRELPYVEWVAFTEHASLAWQYGTTACNAFIHAHSSIFLLNLQNLVSYCNVIDGKTQPELLLYPKAAKGHFPNQIQLIQDSGAAFWPISTLKMISLYCFHSPGNTL